MSNEFKDNREKSPNSRYIKLNRDKIGQGGQKKVFKAYDTIKGIEVAWNEIDVSPFDSKIQEQIYKEIEILQKCNNQCVYIIKLYDNWIDNSREKIIFITEIATSGSLREFINKVKNIKLRIIKKWIKQILYGIKFLHDNDIIHRDIKCDNIFINGTTGNIIIGDFGLAKNMENDITKTILGTPEFMAPEIYNECYDKRIDIYSFGMAILEIISGKTPYSECDTIPKIWKKVINGIKPKIISRIKHKKLKDIIEKCICNYSNRITIDELLQNEFLNSTEDDDIESFLYGKDEMIKKKKNLTRNGKKIAITEKKIIHDAELEAEKIIKKARKKANKIIKKAKIIATTSSDETNQNDDQKRNKIIQTNNETSIKRKNSEQNIEKLIEKSINSISSNKIVI
jgi:WNK lysine deficient protein kinase|tara:strand:- start:306 stop:1499 length:1194 start_codon:yes stop_codon:yes gene_type:complete